MDVPYSRSRLVINTDGSSFRNGRSDAIAGVGVYFGPGDKRNVGQPLGPGKQTNQRAELMAVKIALEKAPVHQDVLIRTDSMYAINCLSKWYPEWQHKSWKKPAGIFMENLDLIEATLYRINTRHMIGTMTYFWWVKGHAGDPGNEAADKLAVKGSKRAWAQQRREVQAQEPGRQTRPAITRGSASKKATRNDAPRKIFCAIHMPVERRRIYHVSREDVAVYTQGSACMFKVFDELADAARFRDSGPRGLTEEMCLIIEDGAQTGVLKHVNTLATATPGSSDKAKNTVEPERPDPSSEPLVASDTPEICEKD